MVKRRIASAWDTSDGVTTSPYFGHGDAFCITIVPYEREKHVTLFVDLGDSVSEPLFEAEISLNANINEAKKQVAKYFGDVVAGVHAVKWHEDNEGLCSEPFGPKKEYMVTAYGDAEEGTVTVTIFIELEESDFSEVLYYFELRKGADVSRITQEVSKYFLKAARVIP